MADCERQSPAKFSCGDPGGRDRNHRKELNSDTAGTQPLCYGKFSPGLKNLGGVIPSRNTNQWNLSTLQPSIARAPYQNKRALSGEHDRTVAQLFAHSPLSEIGLRYALRLAGAVITASIPNGPLYKCFRYRLRLNFFGERLREIAQKTPDDFGQRACACPIRTQYDAEERAGATLPGGERLTEYRGRPRA